MTYLTTTHGKIKDSPEGYQSYIECSFHPNLFSNHFPYVWSGSGGGSSLVIIA